MSRRQPPRASKTLASQERRPPTKKISNKADQLAKVSSAANDHGGTQVQLQRPPDTVSKETTKVDSLASQDISVEKSLEITQTLLQGCVSLLASMRGMFRLDCYENKYYIFGEASPGAPEQAPPGKFFAGLKKGACHRVDRLINLLELGVTDALRRGFLDSLHFLIYEDPNHPSDILEQWIFTFSYHTDVTTGARVASGVEMTEKKHGSKITVSRAKYSLVKFIQQLAHICSVLPELPEVKYMTMDMWYTENRPPEYKAPGFSRPTLGNSKILETKEWGNTITPIPDRMNTGHHEVSLRLIHLMNRSEDLNITGLPSIVNRIETEEESPESVGSISPERLADTHHSLEEPSKLQQLQQPRPPTSLHSSSTIKPNATEVFSASLRRISEINLDAVPSLGHAATPALQQCYHSPADAPQTHQADAVADTMQNSTEDLLVRDRLRHMLQPRSGYADTQATQVLTDSTLQPHGEEHTVVRMQFPQATIDKLDSMRSAHLARRKDTSLVQKELNVSSVVNGVGTVKCQCGSLDVDANMLHCGFCNTLQHVACYGFNDRHDKQIPCVHICYACLLRGEHVLLGQLTYHALCRRALYMLEKQSFNSEKQFAQAIGCSTRDCMNIVKKFRQAGLLGGSRKTRQVVLNRSPESTTSIAATYFDPTYRIGHHLGSFEGSTNSSTKRARDVEDNASNLEAKRPKVGSRVTEDFDLGGWWSPNPS